MLKFLYFHNPLMQCSCSVTGCGWRVAAVKIVPTLLTNVKKCEECNLRGGKTRMVSTCKISHPSHGLQWSAVGKNERRNLGLESINKTINCICIQTKCQQIRNSIMFSYLPTLFARLTYYFPLE